MDKHNKKYVLYGAGWEAERFFYQFHEKEKVAFVIDANKRGNFHGLNIYRFEDVQEDLNTYEIIITSELKPYFKIRKILNKNHYYNYIWSMIMHQEDKRKIVVINANCHYGAYKEFLLSNSYFNEYYRIIDIPSVQDWTEEELEEGGIPKELLAACDLYIHKDIRAANKISYLLSDEYIIPKLKSECICITVPNMVGFGRFLFPVAGEVTRQIELKTVGGALWTPFCTDLWIDELYEKYHCLAEIMQHIGDIEEKQKKKAKKIFIETMEKLKLREVQWDVKISDFIMENYQKEKLFFDDSHPTPVLMEEICRRLGRQIGLEDRFHKKYNLILHNREMFVYPFVKDALSLQWEEQYIRQGVILWDKLSQTCFDMQEYVRQYIWWKYDDDLER